MVVIRGIAKVVVSRKGGEDRAVARGNRAMPP